MHLDLSGDETAAFARPAKPTIDGDRYPLSARIRTLQGIRKRYPGKEQFTGGSACSGLYRGVMLWAATVNEVSSLRQEDVIVALDHARIAEGPGGPAEMVPGQHHVRMNIYIARRRTAFRDRREPGGHRPRRNDGAGCRGVQPGPMA
jgi:hypothetical protein